MACHTLETHSWGRHTCFLPRTRLKSSELVSLDSFWLFTTPKAWHVIMSSVKSIGIHLYHQTRYRNCSPCFIQSVLPLDWWSKTVNQETITCAGEHHGISDQNKHHDYSWAQNKQQTHDTIGFVIRSMHSFQCWVFLKVFILQWLWSKTSITQKLTE